MTGIMFWNHGDNYSTGNAQSNWNVREDYPEDKRTRGFQKGMSRESQFKRKYKKPVSQKSLCLQNYRLIIRMIDEQGWILRNTIIWHKNNGMPSSVRDRFSNKYEPIFMLVKNKRYWFDLDAVIVPFSSVTYKRAHYKYNPYKGDIQGAVKHTGQRKVAENLLSGKLLGKNPGDVWTISTQPFSESHFATFPEKLIEPMVKAGCPQQICKKCGKARERIIDREVLEYRAKPYNADTDFIHHGEGKSTLNNSPVVRRSIGWTDCGCNAGWEAGIVLDPFMGAGTTGVVATRFGCRWIGIELNKEYCDMAIRRIKGTQIKLIR